MNTIPTGEADVLKAALAYAAAGVPVLPVDRHTKAPLIRRGVLAASTEGGLVRRWFTWRRGALVAIATGQGFGVVDVDPRHGGTVSPQWPATLAVQTRSGGFHFYYATSAPIRNSRGKIAPGVDFRGVGGYVVAPPSPGWVWLDSRPMAALPESLVQACGAAVSPGARRRGRRELPADWRPFAPARQRVPEGERNEYLARFAGWALRQGIPAADLARELDLENTRVCDPPLDDRTMRRTAASIGRYETPPQPGAER